nr:MAG TPA: hypothetical protein [Caudoviricetes sp.]
MTTLERYIALREKIKSHPVKPDEYVVAELVEANINIIKLEEDCKQLRDKVDELATIVDLLSRILHPFGFHKTGTWLETARSFAQLSEFAPADVDAFIDFLQSYEPEFTDVEEESSNPEE